MLKCILCFLVRCSSVHADEPVVNGIIGYKVYLRWIFTVTKDDVISQIFVFVNQTSPEFAILNGVTPAVQEYGIERFGKRLTAVFTDNIYTLTINNVWYNDSSSYILLAQFSKKTNIRDINFSEAKVDIRKLNCKYIISSFFPMTDEANFCGNATNVTLSKNI